MMIRDLVSIRNSYWILPSTKSTYLYKQHILGQKGMHVFLDPFTWKQNRIQGKLSFCYNIEAEQRE